jgi:diacylglycerol kinase
MDNVKKTILSFRHALRGLRVAAKESSFKIMIGFALFAVWLTFRLPLDRWEQIVIYFLIGSVLSTEIINSQIERVLDLIQPNYDLRVKNIKDLSAGAVLVISITALLIGILIFIPYIIVSF